MSQIKSSVLSDTGKQAFAEALWALADPFVCEPSNATAAGVDATALERKIDMAVLMQGRKLVERFVCESRGLA